jgi:DNA-binding MarR family transcriptional regulator
VRRRPDPAEGRAVLLEATASGRGMLRTGRRRRVAVLAREVSALTGAERLRLRRALPLIERIGERLDARATAPVSPVVRRDV